ncbi:MAG: phosphohydrolase, partial [Hymenobacter sp.]
MLLTLPIQKLITNFSVKPREKVTLQQFCSIDDYDVLVAIKNWCSHQDKVLSLLCQGLVDRHLLKVQYQPQPFDGGTLADKTKEVAARLQISEEDAGWLVFTGEAVSSTYNFEHEHIYILFKSGAVKD